MTTNALAVLPDERPLTKYDRVYLDRGYLPTDIAEVKPNMILLEGIAPPEESKGGITLPFMSSVAGAQCLMFRVQAIGAVHPDCFGEGQTSFRRVNVGDVVIVRNAQLDPISSKERPLFVIDIRDVLAIVDRAPA